MVLVLDVINMYSLRIPGDSFRIELNGVNDSQRVSPVRPQEKFRIIEIVEILNGIGGSKLYAFDFLKVYEKGFLLRRVPLRT